MVTPGRTLFLTIEAVNRQFRFVPVKDVIDSINFIFWYAVEKYEVSVHEMTWMSNHAHICITDNAGVLPKFIQTMNSLISKQLNALRGLTGSNIEKGYSEIEVVDDISVTALCAYTLANPCAAGLVERARDWKGISTYHLEYGQRFTIQRPACGLWKEGEDESPRIPRTFRPKLFKKSKIGDTSEKKGKAKKKPSTLPASVSGVLSRPRVHSNLSDPELRARIRNQTTAREQRAAEKLRQEGKSVMGWRQVITKKWNDYPSTFRTLFEEIPRIIADAVADKIQKGRTLSAFYTSYQNALETYIQHGRDKALFPWGTWMMRERFKARCEASPSL